ncbi:hypothetical protein PV327_005149 [Microctonus hyperodae]|uniref:Alcohol dehydrogenase n=1 Tax=Microctonus hyperodae TaxID=165561 RepID=A0AA39G0T7_MICHY|nr:hypothetical protein PV327_005149 [Microctonus hyperodae]
MQIKDKKAILVGTNNRLGVTFCRELLRNGAGIIVIMGNEESSEASAVDELNSEFGQKKVIFFPCDVSNNDQYNGIFKEAVGLLGGLDILINNVDLIDENDIMKAIDVNVTAVIRGTLLGVQQMGKDLGGKGGIIVNVTSIIGLEPVAQFPVYSTAKQAIISFSRSFAQPYHYQRTGVKIVVLCPGLSGSYLTDDLNTLNNSMSIAEPGRVIIQLQKVEKVAHGLVYVIRCAQNGSIWVSEDNQPVYEIQPPDTLPQKQDGINLSDFKNIRL